jgi:hypothetical protein
MNFIFRPQTQQSYSKQSKPSHEMSRFLNTMCEDFLKTFLYYFHSLPIVYHEVSMNLMIFKLGCILYN